ncbi:lytic polysaccharide monooxygenase [Streptomyces sp. NPDC059477]|uniref:lytic polysaccharide monooxygenase auxiliary activity family 9 protein n=1 Tax=Streptomyces sp. NPDC059477 TaxID=3346847 RepID=UPI0036B4032B
MSVRLSVRLSVRRKAAAVAAVGVAPLALTALSTAPASAHGALGDPVSRVSQCLAEGPENPKSAACKAAVAAGGTQALYDWNGIRIGNADGRHQELIPDGKLCSANDPTFKGLDLARADWPATSVKAGSYNFKFRVTAPHQGAMKVYLTKPGFDPSKALAWGDLDLANPVASTATTRTSSGGFYTFQGTLPERSGQHVLYAVWQRSDSPEAFYSCSDVTFGGASGGGTGTSTDSGTDAGSGTGTGTGSTPAPTASAPSQEQIDAGTDKSTIENNGHGDHDPATTTDPTTDSAGADSGDSGDSGESGAGGNEPQAAGAPAQPVQDAGSTGQNLAETGGDSATPMIAVGGAAALALGSAALFASVRRRARNGG